MTGDGAKGVGGGDEDEGGADSTQGERSDFSVTWGFVLFDDDKDEARTITETGIDVTVDGGDDVGIGDDDDEFDIRGLGVRGGVAAINNLANSESCRGLFRGLSTLST